MPVYLHFHKHGRGQCTDWWPSPETSEGAAKKSTRITKDSLCSQPFRAPTSCTEHYHYDDELLTLHLTLSVIRSVRLCPLYTRLSEVQYSDRDSWTPLPSGPLSRPNAFTGSGKVFLKSNRSSAATSARSDESQPFPIKTRQIGKVETK